jgi:hypothetical protein
MDDSKNVRVDVYWNGKVMARGTWKPGAPPVLGDGDVDVGADVHTDIGRVFERMNEKYYHPILLASGEETLPHAHEENMSTGHYRVVFL